MVPASEPVPMKSIVNGSKSNPPPIVFDVFGAVALHNDPLMSKIITAAGFVAVSARLPKNGVHPPSGVASKPSSVRPPATVALPKPPVAVPVSVRQVQAPLEPGHVAA